jgi:hypothetical protein
MTFRTDMATNKESIEELLWRLAFGIEQVPQEPLRFYVQSKSSAGAKYIVDKNDFVPNGSCTCDRFTRYGVLGRLERGERLSQHTKCEHIRRVDAFLSIVSTINLARCVKRGQRDEVLLLTSVPQDEEEAKPLF